MNAQPRLRLHSPWVPYLFLAPFLTLFVVFTGYPLVQSLVLAFQQTFGPRVSAFVGLDNFKFLLHDPQFWRAFANNTVYTAGSIFLQLPISLGLALLLNRPGLRNRALFRLIFFAPSLVGLVFVAMLFSLVLEKRTGLLNVVLNQFAGFPLEYPWLDEHAMLVLILVSVWMYAGFNMLYFLAALQNVPQDLVEAAVVDGANAWQRFWHITVPAIRPVLGFVVLLSVVGSFQLFELPYLLLNGAGVNQQGLTIVMYLYQNGFETGDLGYASAIGWVLALILIGVTLIQRRLVADEA